MPSKLPIIKANTTQENIDKMKVIAQENKRSVAKELEYLIERRIKEYESKNGVNELDKSKELEFSNIVNAWCETFYKSILKQSEKSGKTPRELWNEYLSKQSEKKLNKPDFKLLQDYIEQHIAKDEME